MEQSGEYRIAAARDLVWQGLNDPAVLSRCIDGCEIMERRSDERFDATVKAKVGPVSARFQVELSLDEIDPPNSYRIHADVKGGAAGFARGAAHVHLEEAGEHTLLRYSVKASVGGKLAQVGSRLIDGTARKMAEDFFTAFGREISGGVEPVAGKPAGAAPADAASVGELPAGAARTDGGQDEARRDDAGRNDAGQEDAGRNDQWKIWLVVFVALVVALVLVL